MGFTHEHEFWTSDHRSSSSSEVRGESLRSRAPESDSTQSDEGVLLGENQPTLSEYEDLAREYEQHIEMTHPDYVTSNRLSPWAVWSKWNRTAVKYYEYRGPTL